MFGGKSVSGAIIIAAALTMAGCGKSEAPAPQAETAAPAAAPQEAAQATPPSSSDNATALNRE